MWMNMYSQRKRATRNRTNAFLPQRPIVGVQWPITHPRHPILKKQRSTLTTNKQIWLSAFQGLVSEEYNTVNVNGEKAVKIAEEVVGKEDAKEDASSMDCIEQVQKCKNWRDGYKHFVNLSVIEGCRRPSNAMAMARAGLEAASNLFTYIHPKTKVNLYYIFIYTTQNSIDQLYYIFIY